MIRRSPDFCESGGAYSIRRDRNIAKVDRADTPEQIGASTTPKGEFVQSARKGVVERKAIEQAECALLNGVEVERGSRSKLSGQLVSMLINIRLQSAVSQELLAGCGQ